MLCKSCILSEYTNNLQSVITIKLAKRFLCECYIRPANIKFTKKFTLMKISVTFIYLH